MKFFRTIIASAMLAVCSVAMADDYKYLTIGQYDGESSYSVSSIQKITFDTSNMILHLTDGTTASLPLSSLSKMFFSATSSDIATVGAARSDVQFSHGMLRADISRGESVSVYNMSGHKVFSTNESGIFDLSNLSRGVYIIRVGDDSRKVINR